MTAHAAGYPHWVPGAFAVVGSDSLVGQSIAWMQHLSGAIDPDSTGWVHVITGLRDGMIGEAEPGGYRVVPFHYDPSMVWWSMGRLPHDDPTQTQAGTVVAQAHRMAQLKVGYSELDYLAIAAHQWHLPAPGLRGYIKASGHLICSQALDMQYQLARYALFDDNRWNGYVRPCDLAGLIGAPPRR